MKLPKNRSFRESRDSPPGPLGLDTSSRNRQNLDVHYFITISVVAAILAAARTFHVIRSRAMRRLAARLGFRYMGPTAPPRWWLNPTHFEGHSSLPRWVSHLSPSGYRMRQAWNVIEGSVDGASVFIFDAVVGENRGGQPLTVIAWQSPRSTFGEVPSGDREVQIQDWSILHGTWLLWFSWPMLIGRVERRVKEMQVNS